MFAAGCAKNPLDVAKSVQDATGAVMKALQTGKGR
jgi:quinone-modifying oxidoreductase subunit QmoA